jgi:hypothetical protein
MQCQCECTTCESDGRIFPSSACRYGDGYGLSQCVERSVSNCGVLFTDPPLQKFCTVKEPYRWPPLFDLTLGLDSTDYEFYEWQEFMDENSTGAVDYDDSDPTVEQHLHNYADENVTDSEQSSSRAEYLPFSLHWSAPFPYTSAERGFADAVMMRLPRNPSIVASQQSTEVWHLLACQIILMVHCTATGCPLQRSQCFIRHRTMLRGRAVLSGCC